MIARNLGYYQYHNKILARQKMIDIFRSLTGKFNIDKDRQYWTLCNEQNLQPGSEIMQMITAGLINAEQFFGVDRDPCIIEGNKVCHPTAQWFAGEWDEVIEEQAIRNNFNPQFIYLDLTGVVDSSITERTAAKTLNYCKPDTVVFINCSLVNMKNGHKGDECSLIEYIKYHVPNYGEWHDSILTFTYRIKMAKMKTFVYWKKLNDK